MSGMSYGDFKEIPSKNEKASHQTAGGHKVITANEQSVVMLPFLAAGESFASLSFQFKISDNRISYVVLKVFDTIMKVLVPSFLKTSSLEFENYCKFRNILGVIDKKHAVIQQPENGGLHY